MGYPAQGQQRVRGGHGDVLAVYTRPRDPDIPLVCLDETSKQLIAETRAPIPMKEGRPARFDYEYERNGTANLFMMFAPLEGWPHVKVTARHTAVDYAHALKDLADIHFLNAKKSLCEHVWRSQTVVYLAAPPGRNKAFSGPTRQRCSHNVQP